MTKFRPQVFLAALLMMTGFVFASFAHAKSTLLTGEMLKVGEYLVSDNQAFYVILQADGNLCVYKGSGPSDVMGLLWMSDSSVGRDDHFYAVLQSDGNFAMYSGTGPRDSGRLHWDTRRTAGGGSFALRMQDDGNLVVYNTADPKAWKWLWGSQKTSPVTWLPHGSFIHNTSLGGRAGYMYWGYFEPEGNRTLIVWANYSGQPNAPEKWKLMPNGEIRRARDSSCLQLNRNQVEVMGQQYGWKQFQLEIAACDGSVRQQGWSISNGIIRHKSYPDGCLDIGDYGAGWTYPEYWTEWCRIGGYMRTNWEVIYGG
jgi:hypothetical protein